MGYSSYSNSDRTLRSKALDYATAPRNEIFTQQKEHKAHKDMLPKDVEFREARDSTEHPNTVPIQFYLDVTGSMGNIPHQLVKDGLPKLISNLTQRGVPDIALMFGAIGDHECDNYPLQVAQFESGDAELDMWLTRTYLECGGGANSGESYALAWYFAANHVKTDATDKRGKKGFVFTVGDEPYLNNYPASAIKAIMGDSCTAQNTLSATELYAAACETNHVFHLNIQHGYRNRADDSWKQLMGDNLIEVQDYNDLPNIISELILSNMELDKVTVEDTITEETML